MAPTQSESQFDPGAHAALTDLGERLRELAGDAAYKAGRDYLRKGNVHDGAVADTSAHATVKGSTDYRVSVIFPSVDGTKVTCTCPAHRRSKYCKHVVAVCAALLDQPAAFTVLEALPEPPRTGTKKAAPKKRGASTSAKAETGEMPAAGLEVLDRLLVELTDGGLLQLGPEKISLIEKCAELVRALKLRRLGNLLKQLQRAVAVPVMPSAMARLAGMPALASLVASHGGGTGKPGIDAATFSRLVLDLYLCRVATGAQLGGAVALDPRLAEDLLGKTWRAEELEPASGLELVQVAGTVESDGEFSIESSYLADVGSMAIYVERQITPIRLSRRAGAPKQQHAVRLTVEEGGLHPGVAPRRIRLGRTRRAPLRAEDFERLVQGATDDLGEIQRRLVERAAVPFGQPEVMALFRPALMVAPPEAGKGKAKSSRRSERAYEMQTIGAVDRAGRFVSVQVPGAQVDDLATIAQAPGAFALFGTATLGEDGLAFRCLTVVVSPDCPTWPGSLSRIVPETW